MDMEEITTWGTMIDSSLTSPAVDMETTLEVVTLEVSKEEVETDHLATMATIDSEEMEEDSKMVLVDSKEEACVVAGVAATTEVSIAVASTKAVSVESQALVSHSKISSTQ